MEGREDLETPAFAQKATPANSFLGKAVEMYTY